MNGSTEMVQDFSEYVLVTFSENKIDFSHQPYSFSFRDTVCYDMTATPGYFLDLISVV